MNRIINALRVWFGRDQPAQPTAPIGLRCRPGDLAFVTRDINYLLRGFVYLVPMQDRIVRVTKQSGYLDCWLLDQPAAVSPVTSRCGRNCIEGGLVYAVPDRYLRPIRCDGLGDETPTDATAAAGRSLSPSAPRQPEFTRTAPVLKQNRLAHPFKQFPQPHNRPLIVIHATLL